MSIPPIYISLASTALAFTTPLLLAALGELIGERAGVLNIGLEGMMLGGAWAAAAASYATQQAPAGVVMAMAAGMAMAALFAWLTLNLRADPIVVGTGLNLFALGLTGVLHRELGARAGDYRAVPLPQWCFVAAAALLAPLLWWGFGRTRAGLRVRAVGEYPEAAEAAGINVLRTRWLATLANGALCGLGGAFLSMSQTDFFVENTTNGRGFIALAIVIFGRWSPLGAVGAALLFGAAQGAQFLLQSKLPTLYYPLLLALPYFLTLLTLAGFSGRSRPPAALGLPYDR